MSVRLIVARHGNTFKADEPSRRIGADSDLPLTERGREQARALGAAVARAGDIERIITGPLRRTRETAALVATALSGTTSTSDAAFLREIDHGPDEGQVDSVVIARVGAKALARWNEEGIAPPGWVVGARERIAGRRQLVVDTERPTLVVTSSGTARVLFLAFPDLTRPASLALKTGHYGELTISDGIPKLHHWNIDPHAYSATG